MSEPVRHDTTAQAEQASFVALYRRYVGAVHRYFYGMVGNRADAEDLTSQVFSDALASWSRYHEDGQSAAWLFRIARRRCVDHYRRLRPALPLGEADVEIDPIPGLETEIDRRALGRAARELAGALDQDEQELLRLRFAADLTYAQIGDVLGRQPGAVKMAIHRLLDRMAEQLEAIDVHAH